jgi:hypothetical protein
MSIRGTVTMECDTPNCRAELVIDAEDADLTMTRHGAKAGFSSDWLLDDGGELRCPDCQNESRQPERDDAYERAAARARTNDFAETGGKDWT